MLNALLWTLTVCICGAMGALTTTGLLAFYDWAVGKVTRTLQLREAEQEMHLKALRSAAREVDD